MADTSGFQRRVSMSLCAIALGLFLTLAVDGELSPAAAFDRWVGAVVVPGAGTAFDFIVLVDPGRSASFEWRDGGNVVVFSGPLAASVSGSRVTGTLYPFGGVATQNSSCCRPCNFRGTISGNRVDGAFDSATCTDDGSVATFFLLKQ